MIRIWRSFRRWQTADPRPTLRQWIRGVRCPMWIDDKFIGFSTTPTITRPLRTTLSVPEITEGKIKLFLGEEDE